MRIRSLVLLFVPAALVACNDDTTLPGGAAPQIVLETEVPDSTQVEASVSEGEAGAAAGTRAASTSPAQLASLGTIPDAALAGMGVDLYRPLAGGRTTIAFDVDADGAEESVQVFKATAGPTFLAWTEAGSCYLTFVSQGVGWYFAAECGADGGLVCRYAPEMTCTLCDAEYCSECTADESNPRLVSCEEIVPPVPDAGPDTTSDVGYDTDGSGEADTSVDTVEDSTVTDTVEDTTVVVDPGQCSDECMSFSGATCCTDCGCTGGSGECLPVCSPPYEWDCEIRCCFDYSTFECLGGQP